MGGGHAHPPLQRSLGAGSASAIAPEAKLAAALVVMGAVVATRREAVWAFIVHGGLVALAAMLTYLPLTRLARRLVIELPFVAFAFLLPFVGRGDRVDVLGISLSRAGLWGGWNVLAKGTLGVATTAVLAHTTSIADLLLGLKRLRVPALLTAIAGFMVRYADVLRGEANRMRIARVSRGDNPRWIWQARALASGSGALFVRSYERGERVHVAMQSRGFTGEMPDLDARRATRTDWLKVAWLPAVAASVAITSWWLT